MPQPSARHLQHHRNAIHGKRRNRPRRLVPLHRARDRTGLRRRPDRRHLWRVPGHADAGTGGAVPPRDVGRRRPRPGHAVLGQFRCRPGARADRAGRRSRRLADGHAALCLRNHRRADHRVLPGDGAAVEDRPAGLQRAGGRHYAFARTCSNGWAIFPRRSVSSRATLRPAPSIGSPIASVDGCACSARPIWRSSAR